MLTTTLTTLLGVETPIVAPPMRGASGGALAAQVSLAGGFGFLSPASGSAEAFTRELDLARSALGASSPGAPLRVGAGFIGWLLDEGPEHVACLDAALAQRVQAVWLSFGDDLAKWVRHVRAYDAERRGPGPGDAHRTLIWVVVSSVAEAQRAAQEWQADVLVVQGIEAGGHGHSQAPPLLTLLPMIRRALPPPNAPPLVAAGGLVDGAHVAAVLMLGAAGAVIGTRFLLTPESTYPPGHKTQLLAATDTVRTLAYDEVRGTVGWPAGIDGRALPNKVFQDKLDGVGLEERKRLYQEAVRNNDDSRSVVWAGASVGLVTQMGGAAALVRSVHEELRSQLSRASAILG